MVAGGTPSKMKLPEILPCLNSSRGNQQDGLKTQKFLKTTLFFPSSLLPCWIQILETVNSSSGKYQNPFSPILVFLNHGLFNMVTDQGENDRPHNGMFDPDLWITDFYQMTCG